MESNLNTRPERGHGRSSNSNKNGQKGPKKKKTVGRRLRA